MNPTARHERITELYEFLDRTFKSGYVNPLPIIDEIGRLLSLPPNSVLLPINK